MSGIIPEIRVYSPSDKGDDSNESDMDIGKRYFSNGGGGGTKLTLVRTETGFQSRLVSRNGPGSPNSRSRDYISSEPSCSQTEEGRDSSSPKPDFDDKMVPWENTFHMRPFNMSNFTNTTYRSTHRSQTIALNRTRSGFISSSAKSLDILRQTLQRYMNRDIDEVIQQYITKYFNPGVKNIIANNGKNAVSDYHIQTVCRQILEEAKKMYSTSGTNGQNSLTGGSSSFKGGCNSPADQNSDVENTTDGRVKRFGRKRKESETDSEASLIVPKVRRKKGRPPIHQGTGSGRSTPSKIKNELIKREGPKWDPDRLTAESHFIMGARANKALGLGATRGRLYLKHPDVFKYSGDQDDKQWLYDHNLMPATGGKAYMLLVEDIRELAESDEYRNSPGLAMDEIVGFTVAESILSKMKIAMQSMRTDVLHQPKKKYSNVLGVSDTLSDRGSSVFTDTKSAEDTGQEESRTVSPLDDLELLNTDMPSTEPSPYILETCFEDVSPAQRATSPVGSDISNMNEPPLSAPFDVTCPEDNTLNM